MDLVTSIYRATSAFPKDDLPTRGLLVAALADTGNRRLVAGSWSHSLYLAVVVSVSNTVTSFTRTRPLVTRCNRRFDSS